MEVGEAGGLAEGVGCGFGGVEGEEGGEGEG